MCIERLKHYNMSKLTDLKNELQDLKSDRLSLEQDIFALECKIAELEAEEEARPHEPEFDKYAKWDR